MQPDNTPLTIVETRRLECQFRPHYYKEKPQKSTRLKLQGSRKKGCHAHIVVKKCIMYPEYRVTEEELKRLTLHTLRDKKMNALKFELSTNPSAVTARVTCQCQWNKHNTGHPTGKGVARYSQRVNPQVASKIADIVADGMIDKVQVRILLRHYVMHELCKEVPPDPIDRAYFPTDNDLKITSTWPNVLFSCLV